MAQRASDKALSEPLPERLLPDEYLERFRTNLKRLVKFYKKSDVARWTGLSDQAITFFEKAKRTPGLDTFLQLVCYMDTDPSFWFLPPDEFALRLIAEAEGREPFFAPPRSLRTASSPSSEDSGADSGNIAPDPKGVKRTSPTWGRLAALLRQWGASVTTPSPRPAFGHN